MKKLIALFFISTLGLFAQASTATATFTFTVNGNAANTEYFVEQKTASGFVEVVKGPASPIVLVMPQPPAGTVLTYRLRARVVGNQATASAPTAELSAVVPASTPGNFNLVFAFPTP